MDLKRQTFGVSKLGIITREPQQLDHDCALLGDTGRLKHTKTIFAFFDKPRLNKSTMVQTQRHKCLKLLKLIALELTLELGYPLF